MLFSRRVAGAIAALMLVLPSVPVVAGDDIGIVHVAVSDASTGRPLRLVRIFLRGDESQYGYSDAAGVATFDRVPSGTYAIRLEKTGYRSAEQGAIVVLNARETTVQVTLAQTTQPKVIGSVSVRTSATISRGSTDANGAASRISTGLGDALSTLPDLGVLANGFSIDGHDPSQTSLQIDGVPIPGIGGNDGIRGIDPDLFGGASATTTSGNGALGGAVNFRSLEPTVAFQAQLDANISARDSSSTRASVRGTSGSVGFVYAHAARGVNDVLDGLTFRDASGLDYTHANGSFQGGDFVKLRSPFGQHQSVTFTAISAHSDQDEICNRFAGPVPCGFGPGNIDALATLTTIGAYKATIGSTELTANVGEFSQTRVNNGSQRIINNEPDVLSSSARFRGSSATLYAIAPISGLDLFSTNVTNLSGRLDVRYSGRFSLASLATTQYFNGELRDVHQLGSDASLDIALGEESSTGSQNLYAKIGARRKSGRDTIQVHAVFGEGGSASTPTALPFDATTYIFDCPAHAVFGTATGDVPGRRDSRGADASFTRNGAHVSWDASVYAQEVRGSTVSTFVDAASSPDVLPQGFASTLSSLYATPAGCGSANPLQPSDVYLLQSIAIDRLDFFGARLGVSGSLGRSVVAGAFATVQRAAAFAADMRFAERQSIVRPGKQLPNVPIGRATALVDYHPPRSPLEGLALFQYTSVNNPRNLPGSTTVTLGAAYQAARGTVTLALQNATNAFAGRFVSPLHAVDLPTADGRGLPTLAQPLAPRSLQVTYSVRVGTSHSKATVSVNESVAGSEGTMQAPIHPLPATAPDDPLALALDDPRCTPESLPTARSIVKILKDAVTTLNAAHAKNGEFPGDFDLTIPRELQMTARYVKTVGSYAFAMSFRHDTLRAVGACIPISYTDEKTSMERDLAVFPAGSNEQFGFSPRVGFYFQSVGAPINAGVIATSKRALDAPPSAPLTPLGSCSVRFRPIADAIAEVLRSGAESRDLPGVTIHARSHGFARWFEVRFANLSDEAAAEACFSVASTTAVELRSRGYDASTFPTLNYAEPFGFFIVR